MARAIPFKPHLVARLRTVAYQKTVVMKYLDNLIAWGDQLFRRDTIESINEATQLYVLAAEMLGPRPETMPPRARPQVQTFNALEPRARRVLERAGRRSRTSSPLAGRAMPARRGRRRRCRCRRCSYFCVPQNDKLLGYWDTVADRLFKIRHCMNIEGVVRQLPLFEPPIDPALLVRAAAAGVDLGSVLDDVARAARRTTASATLAQKATELCGEVRGARRGAAGRAREARRRGARRCCAQPTRSELLDAGGDSTSTQVEEADAQPRKRPTTHEDAAGRCATTTRTCSAFTSPLAKVSETRRGVSRCRPRRAAAPRRRS